MKSKVLYKHLGFLITLLVFAPAAKAGKSVEAQSRLRYEIVKVSTDAALKKTESAFNFIFVTREGTPVTASIKYSYNGVEKITTANKTGKHVLLVKPGKYKFQFFYNSQHFEVITDSIPAEAKKRTVLKVYFDRADDIIMEDKPVIYLYPEKTTEVNIELKLDGEFLFTYPAYPATGWTVTADADGTLHQGDKTFKYLFWEGRSLLATTPQTNQGFVKRTDELMAFFEEKLAHLGLNSIEMQDFITYWVPRMQSHEKHLIRFVLNEDFNKTAALTVTPKPDRMIRVFMLWSPLEKDQQVTVKEQTLPALKRKGFTLVEWGGSEVEYIAPITKN